MLNTILVILSFIGLDYGILKLLKLNKYYGPIVTIALTTLVVYFGGILGLLLEASYLILTIGLMCFIYGLYNLVYKQEYKNIKIRLIDVGFVIGFCCFMGVLINTKFQHYDNFSHWAIVVKAMLLNNSFPDISNTLVEFTNYPLGTSSFIYYVCRFMGHGENIMLLAQGGMTLSCFYAMFGIIKEEKRFLLYAFLGAGLSILSIFNISIRINNLLVDFLLPIITLAIICIIYAHDDYKQVGFTILPLLNLLLIIKSTGIFFGAIGLLYYLYKFMIHKRLYKIKNIIFYLMISIGSFISYIVWQLHVKSVFSGVVNKFSVDSVETKSMDDMYQIAHNFMNASLDFTTRNFVGIVLANIIVIVAYIIIRKFFNKKWNLLKVLIISDVVLVLYYLGILGLYLFSMPLDEASSLAGFERYASSIVMLFIGVLVICATVDIENSFTYKTGRIRDHKAFKSVKAKQYYNYSTVICLMIAIPLLLSEYNGMQYNNSIYKDSIVNKIENVVGDAWPEDAKQDTNRYLCYGSDHDGQMTNYFFTYVARYYLYAPEVDSICDFYEDNLINLLSQYDYLVIVESDKTEMKLLQKYFNIEGKTGIYDISKLLNNY